MTGLSANDSVELTKLPPKLWDLGSYGKTSKTCEIPAASRQRTGAAKLRNLRNPCILMPP